MAYNSCMIHNNMVTHAACIKVLWFHMILGRGVTGIFFFSEGAKSFFLIFFPGVKCFFPVENSHFGRPKTNLRRFQNWKANKQKKKKKKKSSTLFITFPTTIFNFPSFLLNFHPFSLFSWPFFPRYVSKNFPIRSLWGALCPPTLRLLRHWFKAYIPRAYLEIV